MNNPVVTPAIHVNAHLWVGSSSFLNTYVTQWLQDVLCPQQGCAQCVRCKQIIQRQHHALLWCTPSGSSYTLADIEPIVEYMAFSVQPDEHYFIVITDADRLSAVCANRLLKTIEEPPIGYHFILLATRKEAVLPTIQSRCMLTVFESTTAVPPTLWEHFIKEPSDPLAFAQALATTQLNEHEVTVLINALTDHWGRIYTKALTTSEQKMITIASHNLAVLERTLHEPIMPGSSKIVLRNLFLHLQG